MLRQRTELGELSRTFARMQNHNRRNGHVEIEIIGFNRNGA